MLTGSEKKSETSPESLWCQIRTEAEEAVKQDRRISGFLRGTILDQSSLEQVVINRLVDRLHHHDIDRNVLIRSCLDISAQIRNWQNILKEDICAVFDRDPATHRFMEPVLYFKGFHAIQTHRIAHAFWQQGYKDFAYYLQSRSSSVFQADIHPAARLGSGLFLDHTTGLVAGETAVIEDNVSILHSVTLGGTGKTGGDRHPRIRQGVLIGAGAKILGNVEIGTCSRIAANSVVLQDVPPYVTVAGVPARIVGKNRFREPARNMDQTFVCGDGI